MNTRRLVVPLLIVLLQISVLTTAALAEEEKPPLSDEEASAENPEEFMKRPPKQLVMNVDLGVAHLWDADFDDSPGSVSTTRGLFQFGGMYFIDEKSKVSFNFRLFDSYYDFDGAVDLVPGSNNPFSELRTARLGGFYGRQEDESFSWFTGLAFESSGERGADFSDTLSFTLFGGAKWRTSKSLEIGLGAIVSSQLDGGWTIWPIPFFDWQISEDWRLRNEAGLDRVRFILSYAATKNLDLGIEFGFFGQRYRLASDGPLPSGIFREQRFPAALSAEWRIGEQWVITGYVGVVIISSFRFENEDGDRISSDDLEPAPLGGIGVTFRF